jgi:hypothetical protein
MSTKSSSASKETEEYWQYIERIAKQVEKWPDWKKGRQANYEEKPTHVHSSTAADVEEGGSAT